MVSPGCKVQGGQRRLDLLGETLNTIETTQKIEAEGAAPLREGRDGDVLPDGQPPKQLVDLIALGEPELAHAGDILASDLVPVEQNLA